MIFDCLFGVLGWLSVWFTWVFKFGYLALMFELYWFGFDWLVAKLFVFWLLCLFGLFIVSVCLFI